MSSLNDILSANMLAGVQPLVLRGTRGLSPCIGFEIEAQRNKHYIYYKRSILK